MRTRHLSSSDPVPSALDGGMSTHRPVLSHEVLQLLSIQKNDIVLDATLGGAGHAREIVKGLGGNGLFIGFDVDADAIARTRDALPNSPATILLINADFANLRQELQRIGVAKITKALFDLGWSSFQLDSGRGFSFAKNEPLHMTFTTDVNEKTLTAATIVNQWKEESIADILFGFGGERYARRIAKAIVERRRVRPITTTADLVQIIQEAIPRTYRGGRIHPATRTFQALRIAVNDELGALSEGLSASWKLLEVNGRIAIISFHSHEDRIVKNMFLAWKKSGEGNLITRKPIRPAAQEIQENPRSRSAKLRVVEKISHESKNPKDKQVRPLDFSGET